MDFQNYILGKALIMIPVLYILGIFLKSTPFIKDWIIPWALTLFGVVGCIFIIGFNIQGIIQGILVTGTTVLGHQLVKQTQNKD